jgi:hypothetical protein
MHLGLLLAVHLSVFLGTLSALPPLSVPSLRGSAHRIRPPIVRRTSTNAEPHPSCDPVADEMMLEFNAASRGNRRSKPNPQCRCRHRYFTLSRRDMALPMEHQLAHGPYQGPQERAFRIGLQVTVAPASTYRSRIPRIHGLAGFSRVRLPYASQTQVGRHRARNSAGSVQSSHRTANHRAVPSA